MYLETQRLILRKPQEADVDDYMEFVNSEFVLRYNAMVPVSREKVQLQFTNMPEDSGTLAVVLKETGKMIGMVSVEEDSLRYGVDSKEISYFIREEEARKGYMKEALKMLISYLFETEEQSCITARCFAPNIASGHLLESLGFHREGVLRRCVRGYGGTVFDDCLYSLLKEDQI
ncbi:MAG: GNAT family N-acetyltransferase [Oscillospiraceae bacterium]|nr:GNAT family N-acetyltransferase [Oscillospiraceae bacterium]